MKEYHRQNESLIKQPILAYTASFLSKEDNNVWHPKMQVLIHIARVGLIRKRFNTLNELVKVFYTALVEYLYIKDLIRSTPFDTEQMTRFIRIARGARSFPLTEEVPMEDLLRHLNLLNDGQPTNALMLVFGKAP